MFQLLIFLFDFDFLLENHIFFAMDTSCERPPYTEPPITISLVSSSSDSSSSSSESESESSFDGCASPTPGRTEEFKNCLATAMHSEFPACLAAAKQVLKMLRERKLSIIPFRGDDIPSKLPHLFDYPLMIRWYKDMCWEMCEVVNAWWPECARILVNLACYTAEERQAFGKFLEELVFIELDALHHGPFDPSTARRLANLWSSQLNPLPTLEHLLRDPVYAHTLCSYPALHEAFCEGACKALLEAPADLTPFWLSFFTSLLLEKHVSLYALNIWTDFLYCSEKDWSASKTDLTLLALPYGLATHIQNHMVELSRPGSRSARDKRPGALLTLAENLVVDADRLHQPLPPGFATVVEHFENLCKTSQ
jgi:hypothetical protein